MAACVTIKHMKTDKAKGKLKFIVTSLMLVFTVGFCFTLPHWWLSVSTAQIVYNGKPSLGSRLYRSMNGELILRVSEPNEFAYWIIPKSKEVLSPNFSNFSFYPFAAFVWHTDQYGVDLEYTAKTDINPKIVAGSNFIEFTSLRKKRIKAAW